MASPRVSYTVPARAASKVTISAKEIEKVKPVGDVDYQHYHHKKNMWKIWLVLFIVLLVVFLFIGPGCFGGGYFAGQPLAADNLAGPCNTNFGCNNNWGWSVLYALVISLAVVGLLSVFKY